MSLPDWAKAKVLEALEQVPTVETGTVCLQAQFNYSKSGLGSVKVKVGGEEEFRAPEKKTL